MSSNGTATHSEFEVELPAGGTFPVNTAEEVDLWNESSKRYIDDYGLAKANDLILVGAILTQQLLMYRAQRELTIPKQAASAQNLIIKAATEIRELEKALGIDKKTREAGGRDTVGDYLSNLKRAAVARGVRISERVLEYERVMMKTRTSIRILRNADDHDRRYHGITERSIINELEKDLAEIEAKDQQWAKDKGALWVGRL